MSIENQNQSNWNTAIFFLMMQPEEGSGWNTASFVQYQAMAQLWTRSLRSTGYTGDLWLLKDRGMMVSPNWLDGDKIQVGEINWKRSEHEPMNIFAKLHASECFPAANYDRVMGADVDLCAFRPVDHLLRMPGELNAMEQPKRRMVHPGLMGGLLNESDRNLAGPRPGINCGIYACAGAFLPELEHRWQKYHQSPDSEQWREECKARTEQHSFNRMILHEEVDFVPFPASLVKLPSPEQRRFYNLPEPPTDLVVLHYGGKNGTKKAAAVQKWFDRIEREFYSPDSSK